MNINELIENLHQVAKSSPFFKQGPRAIEAGHTNAALDYIFSACGGDATWLGESVQVQCLLKSQGAAERSRVCEKVKFVNYELEVESPMTLRQNGSGERNIEQALGRHSLYGEVLELAAKMNIIIQNTKVYSSWYEVDEPECPSDLDCWAHSKRIFTYASKAEIQGELEKYDLPVSGTKSELRKRLKAYADEHGSVETYERHFSWAGDAAFLKEEDAINKRDELYGE